MSSETGERTPYIGALMLVGWQWVRAQVFEGVLEAGYSDLTRAHVGLFRYPTLDRLRPTEIAEKMQITRQSVHDLLGHLEERGYLTRQPDPSSKRSRIVRLTPKGQRLELEIRDRARQAEEDMAEILGPTRFAELRKALEALIPQLVTGSEALRSSPLGEGN
jgi:DNA-binding MarR family transcriptional regulator